MWRITTLRIRRRSSKFWRINSNGRVVLNFNPTAQMHRAWKPLRIGLSRNRKINWWQVVPLFKVPCISPSAIMTRLTRTRTSNSAIQTWVIPLQPSARPVSGQLTCMLRVAWAVLITLEWAWRRRMRPGIASLVEADTSRSPSFREGRRVEGLSVARATPQALNVWHQ